MFSLDTETTGIDLYHGALPYFVTICEDGEEPIFWEWDINPITRNPIAPRSDLLEIKRWIEVGYVDVPVNERETVRVPKLRKRRRVLQNTKFDYQALFQLYKRNKIALNWNFEDNDDTLLAGHLLNSSQPHDLTSMVLIYLGVNIQPYEDALEEACKSARGIAKRSYPDWRLAKSGMPDMPSAKSKEEKKEAAGAEKSSPWKYDAWLPRAIAQEENYPDDHPWWRVLQEYACADSASTMALFKVQIELIRERGLERIYQERLKIIPIVSGMEQLGITCDTERLAKLEKDFTARVEIASKTCLDIATQFEYELQLPKGSSPNNSLRTFTKDVLQLPAPPKDVSKKKGKGNSKSVLKETEEASWSLSKEIKSWWMDNLPEGDQLDFVKALALRTKLNTQLSYADGYKRFWLGDGTTKLIHPSLNPTGTGTLRWSSSNPNEQNISKQDTEDCSTCDGGGQVDGGKCKTCKGTGKKSGTNLRYIFGPAPGREWWSCDAQNIELRLPAYEAGEKAMIDLFEHPDDPPYYGSYHMLIFALLHPEKFAEHGKACKDIYADTWYTWTKNGNFAVGYGSVESSGTADRAYRIPGAFRKVKGLFSAIHGPGGLNDRMIAHANEFGWVPTIPDKTVDPERGYPIYCKRTNYGRISPTVPLNYHVQSSAMWWMMKAMIRCHAYLQELNKQPGSKGYHLVMQVHDELVFDFPQGTGEKPYLTNLPKINKVKRLMMQGGEDYGIPTPVSCKYHSNNWAVGIAV